MLIMLGICVAKQLIFVRYAHKSISITIYYYPWIVIKG